MGLKTEVNKIDYAIFVIPHIIDPDTTKVQIKVFYLTRISNTEPPIERTEDALRRALADALQYLLIDLNGNGELLIVSFKKRDLAFFKKVGEDDWSVFSLKSPELEEDEVIWNNIKFLKSLIDIAKGEADDRCEEVQGNDIEFT